MIRSEIRTNVEKLLADEGVYRTNTEINTWIDDGNALLSLLSLCDERRGYIDIDGSRNLNPVPQTGNAYCVAPLVVANSNTGYRLAPASVDQLEFYAPNWEGRVGDGSSLYYTLFSPYHISHAGFFICPQQNIGRTQLVVYGAYIPDALSSDSDSPRLTAGFHDVIVLYAAFCGLISEPGKGRRAGELIQQCFNRINELIASLEARFPSSRDYTPWPVEFTYEDIIGPTREPARQTDESS